MYFFGVEFVSVIELVVRRSIIDATMRKQMERASSYQRRVHGNSYSVLL